MASGNMLTLTPLQCANLYLFLERLADNDEVPPRLQADARRWQGFFAEWCTPEDRWELAAHPPIRK